MIWDDVRACSESRPCAPSKKEEAAIVRFPSRSFPHSCKRMRLVTSYIREGCEKCVLASSVGYVVRPSGMWNVMRVCLARAHVSS